jgi:hypothetical protein
MLFSSTAGWFLIGLAGTALTSFFAAIGTQQQPKHLTIPLHGLIVAVYAPLIAISVNMLPSRLIEGGLAGWLELALAMSSALSCHALLAVGHRLMALKRLAVQASSSPTTAIVSHELPQRTLSGHILVNSSVADYRKAVIAAEGGGRDFAFIQRRIAPYLLSDSMLRLIASQRFGDGHPEMNAYISSHQRRRQAFFESLDSGARYREMFSRQTILHYVKSGTHSEEMWPLPSSAIVDVLKNWRDALLHHPNYYVGISDHSLPIKYHLIDNECLILHEPVGKGDDIRLNSFFIYGKEIGAVVVRDFDVIWGLIDPEWRDRQKIARWIKDELIPLARRR